MNRHSDDVAQTPDQMRGLRPLTSSAPPAKQRVAFERIVEHAITGA